MKSGFDRVARIYRWGEYVAFGPLLMKCRTAWIGELHSSKRALVLGDGDGRFTAHALSAHPDLRINAIDSSGEMLSLLRDRCEQRGCADRLTVIQADVTKLDHLPEADTVVTHFFLDCLSLNQIKELTQQLTHPTRWIISEFDTPCGWLYRPALVLIRTLYLTFRLLTGLRTQHLPAWRSALQDAGWTRESQKRLLGGIVVAELWTRDQTLRRNAASDTD